MLEQFLRVGVITKTHGIKGEVKVFPTIDNVEQFNKIKKVLINTGKEKLSLEIKSVKFFKQFVILKFKGIDDINDVEKYVNKDLLLSREDLDPLEDDENYICDLIGLKVITDEGEEFGELIDVLQTGANDVYVVKTKNEKEVLLPAIKECILDVDLENMLVKVHLMKGLLD
ncbi:MAG: 16S rRNA processing protein RimM [Lachnospiraceae bacterium]|nr:16S rRNA processing protein RimM [Lachnospira sp.]MBR6698224.1 16S rRNA processing protein RimM [Lachnospiraceae bacterium]